MTVEELMKPRYKCIANYPQAPYNEGDEHKFIEGDLLIQGNVNGAITFRRYGRLGHMSVGVPCCAHPEKYPKVFQPLFWWEYRRLQDMPDYLFCPGLKSYFMVEQWNDKSFIIDGRTKKHYCNYVPATKEQYESYINQKQQ